jgi:subtilisin family serine protease
MGQPANKEVPLSKSKSALTVSGSKGVATGTTTGSVLPSPVQLGWQNGAADNTGASKVGAKVVWVVMKQQAKLTQAAAVKDWKVRGQNVHSALTSAADNAQSNIRAALMQKGVKFKPFWIVNALRVEADQATIDEIAKRSDVARIVDDRIYSIPKPMSGNTVAKILATEWNLDNIGAPKAWDAYGTRGEGIVVANIDTGVQYDHPALVKQYRGNLPDGTFDHNYNWFDPAYICGKPSTTPCDNAGHGTHTMGTMVGDDGDPGENQIGVAPHARWIAAKGCEDFGCSTESLLASAQWVLAPTDLSGQNPRTDLRPNIVNNSWGGGSGDTFFQEVVQAWVAAGIFPAFSTGNNGEYGCGSANSPGDYPESYATGAYDINNQIAYWSSRGPSYFEIIKPNISAPGVEVRSSVPGNGYESWSGTSMASPHLAGAVALMWSAAPALVGDIETTRAALDESALDTSDESCGGTPDNNNVFGEGRLDVVAALDICPIGPTGTLEGVVTSAVGGTPIVNATLLIQGGTRDRTVTTNDKGAYKAKLEAGKVYSITAKSFGYVGQNTGGVEIVEGQATTLDFVLVEAPSYELSGSVKDTLGKPMVGATVTILGTPIAAILTDQSGQYSFAKVPAGEYQVKAESSYCYDAQTLPVTLSANATLDFSLPLRTDAYGYHCNLAPYSFIDANTVLPIGNGIPSAIDITLPFPFTFYGQTYDAATVWPFGYVSFLAHTSMYYMNTSIPDPGIPNATIYPFWDMLWTLDSTTSSIRTEVLGTAPNRQFVIEWRDLTSYEYYDNNTVRFEVVLFEKGQILMQYATDAGQPWQQGSSATIGLENELGTVAFQYSYNKPSVQAGTAVLFSLPPSGIVEGTVVNANDGLPIARTEIQALMDGTVVRTTDTTSKGFYRLQLPEGTYSIVVGKKNYGQETFTTSVAVDQVIRKDFSLKTGKASVTPTSVQVVTTKDQSRIRVLTVENTGSLGFDYSISEAGGRKVDVQSQSALVLKPDADPNAFTTKGLFEDGIEPPGWSASATGEVIRSFTPQGMTHAWGVGSTGNLWLSEIEGTFANHEFTPEGTPTGRNWNTNWAEYFAGDMAFDPSHNAVCQVNVGGDNGIYCWDTETGDVVDKITGSFPWSQTSQRGLAYRADDDSFYIGGWNEGVIYHINGLSSDEPGTVIETCKPSDGSISGLAYNSSMGVLWMATNSPTDTIYELNPDDCTVLSTLAHPSAGFNGAGMEMDDEGNLWMIGQYPNTVYLIESGVPAFSDVAWITVEPTSGTVAPGKSASFKVTVNTAGMEPGVYLASIFLRTTAAKESSIRIPVSLVVSSYQQGVNAGGKAYTDTLGDPWAKDAAYTAGSWGYTQKKSRTTSTSKKITGTTDPTLFQSERIDPYAYRFDNVPNGIYQVDLKFAELRNTDMGERLFDVIVEDTEVLPAHDIAYEVGTYTAEDRTFFVEVTDGRMDVRLVSLAGYQSPVINALRVTHRPDR